MRLANTIRTLYILMLGLMMIAATSCSKPRDEIISPTPGITGSINNDWSKETCYGNNIDIAGPIDTYTHGLWTMAVTGSISSLQSETGGSSTSGQIPTGNQLGDDPEGAGYASQMLLGGYVYAMYHPTGAAPDHFIVYHIDTGDWWRYDLGNNEKRCTVTLISRS